MGHAGPGGIRDVKGWYGLLKTDMCIMFVQRWITFSEPENGLGWVNGVGWLVLDVMFHVGCVMIWIRVSTPHSCDLSVGALLALHPTHTRTHPHPYTASIQIRSPNWFCYQTLLVWFVRCNLYSSQLSSHCKEWVNSQGHWKLVSRFPGSVKNTTLRMQIWVHVLNNIMYSIHCENKYLLLHNVRATNS